MTIQSITESGMTFGPFPDGNCFYIEKSTIYQNIQEDLKIAEFLLLHHDNDKTPTIWIVEAKSSTPRPETQPNFDKFITEIHEKLVNAFFLGIASCLKRHPQAEKELPEPFKSLNFSEIEVRFVLIINGHQENWLPPIQDALKKLLRATVKTWALSPTSVVVLNDKLARNYGLILSENKEIVSPT